MPRDSRRDPRLDLEPVPASARRWLFVLAVALPAAITAVALAVDTAAAGTGDAATAAAVLAGISAFLLAVWWLLDRLLRRHRLQLGGGGIEVATTFYHQSLPLSELDLVRARVVDLGERPELRPLLKTNGFALPGFHSGWFRLRDRSRAFVAMARGPRVLLLPTRRGHVLLLQPRQPQALLDALRALAGTAARGERSAAPPA